MDSSRGRRSIDTIRLHDPSKATWECAVTFTLSSHIKQTPPTISLTLIFFHFFSKICRRNPHRESNPPSIRIRGPRDPRCAPSAGSTREGEGAVGSGHLLHPRAVGRLARASVASAPGGLGHGGGCGVWETGSRLLCPCAGALRVGRGTSTCCRRFSGGRASGQGGWVYGLGSGDHAQCWEIEGRRRRLAGGKSGQRPCRWERGEWLEIDYQQEVVIWWRSLSFGITSHKQQGQ